MLPPVKAPGFTTAALLAATLTAFAWVSDAQADVSGRVIDDVANAPIVGAIVSVRARPDIAPAFTAADGTFVLQLSEQGVFEIAAARAYSATAANNFMSDTLQVFDGFTGAEIRLLRLPTDENTSYQPPAANQLCIGCHFEYYQEWTGARHAGAAENSWVLDLYSGDGTPGGGAGYVFRDTHDAGDTGTCATCHAPLEDVFNPGQTFLDEVSTPSGLDGVTCLACHQMAEVNDNVDALHFLGNSTYRFPLSNAQTSFHVFGNLPDTDLIPMQNVYQPQFGESQFCASCHQYKNQTTGAPGQATFTEWQASPFAVAGPNFRSCQDCHMPSRGDSGSIGSGGPQRPPEQRHSHAFVGATPATLSANIDLRVDLARDGQTIRVDAEVENRTGHGFPTGISIRNAILVLRVSADGAPLPQQSGPVVPFWGSDDVPGQQTGDLAGQPGKGYAKLLEGRINGQGPTVSPVLFIDAEGFTDTLIPSAAIDQSEYRFTLPAGVSESANIRVEAELIYRRAWRALAITKGWTQTPGGMPVEIPVQQAQLDRILGSLGPPPGPAIDPPISIPLGDRLPLWIALALMLGLLGSQRGWLRRS